jgi:hypothetical protein
VRRPVFTGDFCTLVRRQRILDEDALAEGEELDSNILSHHCEAFRVGSLRNRSEPGTSISAGPARSSWPGTKSTAAGCSDCRAHSPDTDSRRITPSVRSRRSRGIAAAAIAREDTKRRQRQGRLSCFTRGGEGDGWQRDRCGPRIIEFQASARGMGTAARTPRRGRFHLARGRISIWSISTVCMANGRSRQAVTPLAS